MVVNTRKNKYDIIKKVSKKRKNLLNQECPICYEKISSKNYIVTNCNHKFCCNCLFNCLKNNSNCPICRNEIFKFNNLKEIDTDDLRELNFNIMPLRHDFNFAMQRELINIINYCLDNNGCSCVNDEMKQILKTYFNCANFQYSLNRLFSRFTNMILIKFSGICYRNLYDWLKK